MKLSPPQAIGAKIFHWVTIISLLLMITSGLQIYNANPVFGGRSGIPFSSLFTLGGWLAGGRNWHFAAMWLFSLNLVVYAGYVLISRRWRHRFIGGNDVQALQHSSNPQRRAYAWHRLVYTAILPILALAIFSGLGMAKPAQLHWIVATFGDWQALRIVHFATVPLVLGYSILHAWLAVRVGGERLVESMFWS